MSTVWIVLICAVVFGPAMWLAWMHGYDRGRKDERANQRMIQRMKFPRGDEP